MGKAVKVTMPILMLFIACYVTSALSAECNPRATICEFWLVVEEALTMQDHEHGLLMPYEGQIYAYNDTNHRNPIKDGFIQGDGFWESTRRVLAVNGSIPGPPIIVYEDQQVLIRVTNHLETEGLVMHWHGLHQVNSSYMDGVPMISQCPILPGQTFPYRFTAFPEGTHWYHSHYSVQRTMGIYGAFIVRPRTPTNTYSGTENIMLLSEWAHDYDSVTAHLKATHGLYVGPAIYNLSSALDGSKFGPVRFQSGLINGRGRHWISSEVHNGAPLEVFTVNAFSRNVFRVIGAMGLYPFRVSVDGHALRIVATDGFRVEPEVVDSFIIYPGERIDFVLDENAAVNNYWIRAETLEINVTPRHIAEAVLHYNGAQPPRGSYTNVISRPRDCTRLQPCKVLNCPFLNYPSAENKVCMPFTSLTKSPDENSPRTDGNYTEIFLNVAISPSTAHRASINWRSFRPPKTLGYEGRSGFVNCTCQSISEGPCYCTNTLDFEYQKIYQLVLTNMGKIRVMHPMHMHGHTFQVLKIGLGTYNTTTGEIIADNQDIACNDYVCSKPSWKRKIWLDVARSLNKDTIIVPAGGYVVIRVNASNPGLWFMHCHIDEHQMEGMALLIDSAPERRPQLPSRFPLCHAFADDQPTAKRADENVQVRLMETTTGQEHIGIVGVRYQGLWGIVCDDDWDKADARVVCRQLGYRDATSALSGLTSRSRYDFFLDEVSCTGNETSIEHCSHSPWKKHDCSQNEVAGVHCQVSQGCPSEWRLHEGSCYRLFTDSARTWREARDFCLEQRAHLAIANTSSLNSLLGEMLNRSGAGEAWLGGTDAEHEGSWKWVDGTLFYRTGFWPDRYNNFRQGEPNNHFWANENENCLMMYAYQYAWNDVPCLIRTPFFARCFSHSIKLS